MHWLTVQGLEEGHDICVHGLALSEQWLLIRWDSLTNFASCVPMKHLPAVVRFAAFLSNWLKCFTEGRSLAMQAPASDLPPSTLPTHHRDKRSRTDGSTHSSDPAHAETRALTQAGARPPGAVATHAAQFRAVAQGGLASLGRLPHSPVQPGKAADDMRGAPAGAATAQVGPGGAGASAAPPEVGPGQMQPSPSVPSRPWAGGRELDADDWAAIEWVRRHQPNLGPQHQCLKSWPPHRAAPFPPGVGPYMQACLRCVCEVADKAPLKRE